MTTPRKRIISDALLAKFFFIRGCGYVRFGSSFDTGLAVSLFQDAAEITARAASIIVKAQKSGNFPQFWEHVAKANKPPPQDQLPMETEMTQLNNARVNFKHHGNPPAHADGFQRDCEAFLRMVFKDFLGENFDTLSQADLINDQELRDLVRAAEFALAESRYEDALRRCRDAIELAFERRRLLGEPGIMVKFSKVPPEIIEEIKLHTGNLWTHFRQLRDFTFAGLLGLNIMDYAILNEYLPRREGAEYIFPDAFQASAERAASCVRLTNEYCARLSDHLTTSFP